MSYQFKEVFGQDEKATCLEIRRVVFIEGQGVSAERERRDEEKPCRHFLVELEGKPVATLRVVAEAGDAKIQRMAVLAEHQGQQIGAKMLRDVLEVLAKDENLTRAILGAQAHALSFYRRAGFNVISDAFEDAGITHYLMEKKLR